MKVVSVYCIGTTGILSGIKPTLLKRRYFRWAWLARLYARCVKYIDLTSDASSGFLVFPVVEDVRDNVQPLRRVA